MLPLGHPGKCGGPWLLSHQPSAVQVPRPYPPRHWLRQLLRCGEAALRTPPHAACLALAMRASRVPQFHSLRLCPADSGVSPTAATSRNAACHVIHSGSTCLSGRRSRPQGRGLSLNTDRDVAVWGSLGRTDERDNPRGRDAVSPRAMSGSKGDGAGVRSAGWGPEGCSFKQDCQERWPP